MQDNLYKKILEELINAPNRFSINRESNDNDAFLAGYSASSEANEKPERFNQQSLAQMLFAKMNYQKK